MQTDSRITWLRENVPHFKEANDKAEAARQDMEDNRRKMAAYMSAANLLKYGNPQP